MNSEKEGRFVKQNWLRVWLGVCDDWCICLLWLIVCDAVCEACSWLAVMLCVKSAVDWLWCYVWSLQLIGCDAVCKACSWLAVMLCVKSAVGERGSSGAAVQLACWHGQCYWCEACYSITGDSSPSHCWSAPHTPRWLQQHSTFQCPRHW